MTTVFSEASSTSSIFNLQKSDFNFLLGVMSTLFITFATQLLIFWLNRREAENTRKESFRLKVYELRIRAAQEAYQNVIRVYRAYKVPGVSNNPQDVSLSVRDWFDGQALLLGDRVYETLIYYLFSLENNKLSDQDHAKELVKAENALKSILKKDFYK